MRLFFMLLGFLALPYGLICIPSISFSSHQPSLWIGMALPVPLHQTPLSIEALFFDLPHFNNQAEIGNWLRKISGNQPASKEIATDIEGLRYLGSAQIKTHKSFPNANIEHDLSAFCSKDADSFLIKMRFDYEGGNMEKTLHEDLTHVTNHLISSLAASHLFQPVEIGEHSGTVKFFRKESSPTPDYPYQEETLQLSWGYDDGCGVIEVLLLRRWKGNKHG